MAIYDIEPNSIRFGRNGEFVLFGTIGPKSKEGERVLSDEEIDHIDYFRVITVEGLRVETFAFWGHKIGSYSEKEINSSPVKGSLRFIESSNARGRKILFDMILSF
jgi:hypothetical protein